MPAPSSSVITSKQFLDTNSRWLEALDNSTGKLYFVDLPTQQSSWEAPASFMDRKELALALQKAHADLQAQTGEDTFLAKVRQRFPPPPGKKPPPPPPTDSMLRGKASTTSVVSAASTSGNPDDEVTQLKAANERLQQRLAMLELRLNSESTASMPSPHPPPLPPRVASSNHSINEPPPRPPWAQELAMRNGKR